MDEAVELVLHPAVSSDPTFANNPETIVYLKCHLEDDDDDQLHCASEMDKGNSQLLNI